MDNNIMLLCVWYSMCCLLTEQLTGGAFCFVFAVHLAPLKTVREVITHHGLEGQTDAHLAVLEIGNILSSVFNLMADAHVINKDHVVTHTDVLLTWIMSVFDT